MQECVVDFNKVLAEYDDRLQLKYEDKGNFEAQITIASESLIFSMHSDVFDFYRQHKVRQTEYAKNSPLNTLVGTIHIYNFLTDSFKYNRGEDLGYLVARIFINKDGYYFVEGKRQLGCSHEKFGKILITKDELKHITLSALLYSLNFELLVPQYENVSLTTVDDIRQKISHSKVKTAKRMGFKFNTDDV